MSALRQIKQKVIHEPLTFALPFIGFVFALFLLINKHSIGLSMSGMPVSDANGWSSCTRALSIFGEWPENDKSWCYRRPFFPIVAQFVYFLAGSLQSYLICVNIIFFTIQYFFLAALSKIVKKIGLLFAWVFTSFYWLYYASTQFMSEQLGLILGLAGTIFFWKYLVNRKTVTFGVLSAVFLFLAVLVRPGNLFMFMLPIFLILLDSKNHFWRALLKISLPLVSIMTIVFGYSRFFASKDFLNGGNSWGTVYGLMKNNSSYDVAYSDFYSAGMSESEFWGIVRENSISLIQSHPETFFLNILSNGYDFYSLYFFRIFSINYPSQNGKNLLNIVIVLILIFSITRMKNKFNSNLDLKFLIGSGLLFASEFFFYGISLLSDPVRAMSSSAFLFISILSVVVFPLKSVHLKAQRKLELRVVSSSNLVPYIPVFSLALLLLFHPVGLSSSVVHSNTCPIGSEALVREGLIIRKKHDIKNLAKNYWWYDVIDKVPNGLYLQGFTVNKLNEPESKNFFIPSMANLPSEGEICIKPSNIYDAELQKISFKSGTIVVRK